MVTSETIEQVCREQSQRIERAQCRLDALLELPIQRPGCWEAEPVTKLEDELRAIREALG